LSNVRPTQPTGKPASCQCRAPDWRCHIAGVINVVKQRSGLGKAPGRIVNFIPPVFLAGKAGHIAMARK
jgi:hypothetical protein